jgi:hypothetical protein
VGWYLLDVVIILGSLGALGVICYRLWKKIQAATKVVTAAAEVVGEATSDLAKAQAAAPRH